MKLTTSGPASPELIAGEGDPLLRVLFPGSRPSNCPASAWVPVADGRETVGVQYEVKRTAQLSDADRAALPAKLQARVRDKVGVTMQFTEAPRDSLPRYEFKTRRWTDERKAGRKVEHYLAR